MNKLDINLNQLKNFLYDANQNGYAGNSQKILPQRPGFTEIEFRTGDWQFRDSHAGWYMAPGQETVYFENKPVWAMAYAGGVTEKYIGNEFFTSQVFEFLKESLLEMDKDKPFRGPSIYKKQSWSYISKVTGGVENFSGNEKIYFDNELVFEQNFIGGLIVTK